jgi:hypothetical protein
MAVLTSKSWVTLLLLLASAGAIVSAGYRLAPQSSDSRPRNEEKKQAFRFHKMAEGRLGPRDGAYEVSFGRWQSEDGVIVERLVEGFSSVSRARGAMAVMLRHADRVLEQGEKHDQDGHPIGLRAVMVARSADLPQLTQRVVWRNNSELFIVASTSLEHCLAFEHQVYPQPRAGGE